MSEELKIKDCPFCGSMPHYNEGGENQIFPKIYCKNYDCFFSSYSISSVKDWNTRTGSDLVPIDKEKAWDAALEIIIPYMDYVNQHPEYAPFGIPNIYSDMGANIICQRFGQPNVLSFEDIENIINDDYLGMN